MLFLLSMEGCSISKQAHSYPPPTATSHTASTTKPVSQQQASPDENRRKSSCVSNHSRPPLGAPSAFRLAPSASLARAHLFRSYSHREKSQLTAHTWSKATRRGRHRRRSSPTHHFFTMPSLLASSVPSGLQLPRTYRMIGCTAPTENAQHAEGTAKVAPMYV